MPRELAQLARLERLLLFWDGLRLGTALAPEWLQPGVWPRLQK
jgi:hypothetical protein